MSTSEEQLSAAESETSRSQIMKTEIGPALTRLLRPIYDPSLSPEEEQHARPINDFQDLHSFGWGVVGLLKSRCLNWNISDNPDYEFIIRVKASVAAEHHSHHIFTNSLDSAVGEGITSGVFIPLTVGAQIHRVENDMTRTGMYTRPNRLPIGADDLVPIMQRDSFRNILQRLTRGPNGFLGFPSTSPAPEELGFFEFTTAKSQSPYRRLHITEAFQVKDGEVVGLTQAYHLAAAAKRRYAAEKYRSTHTLPDPDKPYYMSSSGCPVRHEFKDEQGEPQEPLILTANKFLIAALEISARKSTGKTKPAERL